ncbi:MAG: DUF2993 domain-containing protein [Synergistaceae bacterium]|nr:DUF2993 domain-containing protein [Synergistaceae bacterium]
MKINKKLAAFTAAAALLSASAAFASPGEYAAAERIGTALMEELTPESISVTVAPGGDVAWIDCAGASMSGIRIESLRLEAELKELPRGEEEGAELMKMISGSRGEMTLLERDVNAYFAGEREIRGFTGLKFDFTPKGYSAEGNFEADLSIVTINLALNAQGRLGLREDGVYLEDTVIYAEGLRQPEAVTSLVTDRVNPLLSFDKIPFPVEFTKLTMSDGDLLLTGSPGRSGQGERWSWKR